MNSNTPGLKKFKLFIMGDYKGVFNKSQIGDIVKKHLTEFSDTSEPQCFEMHPLPTNVKKKK
jgi:hypothetical protein